MTNDRKGGATVASGAGAGIYDDRSYLDQNPDWHLADTAWKAREIDRILTKNKVAWRSAVEVGCGSGGIVADLARRYPDRSVAGFDVSGDAGTFWTRHTEPNLRLERADFLARDDRYDVLMLIDVFEHVPDYMGFLKSLSGRADHFVFHIPLELHVSGLLRNGHVKARASVGHLHYYSKATALATLADTGYRVDDWAYTALAEETNAGHRAMRTRLLNPVRSVLHSVAPDLSTLLLGGYSLMVLASPAKAP